MTTPARYRRIGWLAALSICVILYALLHIKVNAVHSDVVRAERQIVELEEDKLLLETEFLVRSSQVQLAKLNRINFGYRAPLAEQFLGGERQLAMFGSPRAAGAPAPIMLAGMTSEDGVPPFPQLVSPLTGKPVDEALVEGNRGDGEAATGGRITFSLTENDREARVPLAAISRNIGAKNIGAGDIGQ